MLYRQESLAMISLEQMVAIPEKQIGATKPRNHGWQAGKALTA
jgi:hypothetical protein